MAEIRIKSYQVGPDSPRNPLGGREADGFGDWITLTYIHIRDLRDQFTRSGDENVPAQLAREAVVHYERIRELWLRARDRAWEFSRDSLEVALITDVMTGYAMAAYARECSEAGESPEPGKRTWSLLSSEYLRACLILSQYTGVDTATIAACRDDQDALMALRNTRV